MDAVDLRYSASAKFRDGLMCLALATVPAAVAMAVLERFEVDLNSLHFLACLAAASTPFVLVAGLWRWGRRGRVGTDGVFYAESARGQLLHLAWLEIDGIHAVGREGVELRGEEIRIRFSDDFDGLAPAWGLIGRLRGAALNAELRRRFSAGETVRFRGPDSAGVGIARAAVLFAIVGPIFGSAVWLIGGAWWTPHRMGGDALGCGGLLLFFGVFVTAAFLLRIRSRCGWVEIGPAGLTVQGGTRVECRWADLQQMASSERYGLVFQRSDGLGFGIPRDVANFGLLEELIRSRTGR